MAVPLSFTISVTLATCADQSSENVSCTPRSSSELVSAARSSAYAAALQWYCRFSLGVRQP
ncbi:hypothetical protein CHLRE_02g142346v5 [Chlamydomonas reinhardtii]|uniref:Secreted protein n=1 Tax=Chlamydomonas reinhardtii TaxID=3055 RepID=A0A2K3E4K2_CHLRE|nr:uncharacterized protein CHLRE_02g142346v5 [Chlamydomonas reinhardtii]PNW87657.1 hypothetical protein CHLRE_02g142346v5 [Chlamydomonas reinhardtii]